jgi:2-polyprenyl-3-methyl-5-hydroxy-6-metoxy-1,4-benzoquinol methylase
MHIKHWDEQAEFWAENIRDDQDVFRELYSLPAFMAFIGGINDKKVLDVGCGVFIMQSL